jgi:DNA-binding Lrp family transcriptional regulator
MLSRFGPLYHAEKMGGELTLAAVKVPQDRFEQVTKIINSLPEIAHNYARNHELNMWFVIATDQSKRIVEVIQDIEQKTGLSVYNMPKIKEYFVGLKLKA